MPALVTIRPELLTLSHEQINALLPLFWVTGGAVLAILASVLRGSAAKWGVFLVTILTFLGAAALTLCHFHTDSTPMVLFNNMLVVDRYGHFFNLIFLATGLLTVLASFRYLDQESIQHPEYYVLLVFSVLGMMLLTASLDLIVLFISLEIMSLSVYTLVAFRRTDRRCNEASMKYFILGGVASAVLLYGTALLYGATGSTNIHEILAFSQGQIVKGSALYVLGMWLVISGFLFKVASVPFHMWMPDVYEGAPIPVTGFMTTALKAAAFAAFVRVFISLGYGHAQPLLSDKGVHDVIWICAVLTMVIGNVVALTQTNLKRMLAYSSIAHTGYLLIGLLVGSKTDQAYAPMAIYLVTYAAMNLGAFVILTMMSGKSDAGMNLHDLSGAARRHPWLAFAMAVFLFSMAGIPPTAGFISKYLLFYSAIQAGEIPLVIIAVLCSAVSVYYYLRVLVFMYMKEPSGTETKAPRSGWAAFAVLAMVALTVHVGIMPTRWVEAAKRAVSSL